MTELRVSKKKAVQVPEKATMNFARRASGFNAKKMIPLILVIILAVGLFVKFGFIDQTNKKIEAYNELADKQMLLDTMNTKLAGYDELYAKYGIYSYGWMNDNEVNTIDRIEILGLVEGKVMQRALIKDISINGDVITMNLSGITLQDTSDIVKVLEQDELVKNVAIYSATAQDATSAEIFMSVVLNKD